MSEMGLIVIAALAALVAITGLCGWMIRKLVLSVCAMSQAAARESDRARHDHQSALERIIEKIVNEDVKWATNIHAEERDRQSRYDTSLERQVIRQQEPEKPTELTPPLSGEPNVTPGWPHGRIMKPEDDGA